MPLFISPSSSFSTEKGVKQRDGIEEGSKVEAGELSTVDLTKAVKLKWLMGMKKKMKRSMLGRSCDARIG